MPKFILGFAELADRLGAAVGTPLENERSWAGSTVQETTKGLLYWRSGLPSVLLPWESALPEPISIPLGALPPHGMQVNLQTSGQYPERALSLVDTLVVHYTGKDIDSTPESVNAYHQSLGWPGEGYSLHVMRSGLIYQTQPLNVVGYHCGAGSPPMPDEAPAYAQPYSGRIGWNNWHTIGMLFTGMIPTEEQLESGWWLYRYWLPEEWGLKLGLVAHKVISRGLTECPGDWKKWWGKLE